MSWQPAQESVGQLVTFLKDSLSGFDKTAQKKAELVPHLPHELAA